MKIDKYVFLYEAANDFYSRKYGSPRSLNYCETFILYSVRYLNTPRIATIMAHASQCRYQVTYVYIKRSMRFLESIDFVSRDGLIYSLTYKGRDYLSGVRKYLLNRRL